MKKLVFLLAVLLLPIQASADRGVVIKENVCGSGNAIVETSGGKYIAIEYYSGVYLFKGDVVYGNLKNYGFEELTRKDDKKTGEFFVEDCQGSLEDALEVLCD